MFHLNSNLALSFCAFASLAIIPATPSCNFQMDPSVYYSNWVCTNATLSLNNPDFSISNKSDLSSVTLIEVKGEFSPRTMLNFTNLRKVLISDSVFDTFELKFDKLNSLTLYRNRFPEGSTLANCCLNLEKLSLKRSRGLRMEFTGLQKLKLLSIKYQNVQQITERTFAGLRRLKRLSLIGNSIRTIRADAFKDLPNLKELYIEDNSLVRIDSKVFEPLVELTSLTIYGRNLDALPLWMFSNQRELKEIGLPFRTWMDVDIELMPGMFPQLSFFSFKRDESSVDEETEYVRRRHSRLVRLLNKDNV